MIICPNCGASNKSGSSVCRMCAAPLPEVPQYANPPQGQGGGFPATVIAGDQERQVASAAPPPEIECPNCHTLNEAGWSFCQQCGQRLPAPPPPAEAPQTFKTVPTEMPPPDRNNMQTVVANRPITEPISPPQQQPSPPPQPPPPQPPPNLRTVAEPRPGMPADFHKDMSTVVQPISATEQPAAQQQPPPPQPPAAPPPPPSSGASSIAPTVVPSNPTVQPMASPPAGAIACPKCDYSNSPGNSFCANCGNVLTVARTIVMASPLAAPRGRLHLVMEGGQQGEVFDLSDDTIVGRSQGDITFPHDGFMSGRHARIERRGATYVLTDAGSRNGTFIKIKGEVELKPGDMVLIGKQLFRFEL
ncbi:MAG: double zinc ribbon domain-containing protein [Blastocatellia bacterium]